jgi:hypothetical protein
MPGKDYMKSFMKRHLELTERFASNIKCTRAGVVEETLHEYTDNKKEVVLDVPPTHIWNLDEANMTQVKKKVMPWD